MKAKLDTEIHYLNAKGQCPVCFKKPLTYKRDRKYFCARCNREYSMTMPTHGGQVSNWAWTLPNGD